MTSVPNAGKTTLLAAALGAVPADERIVCVEDAAELAPPHPHLVRLVARGANVEGIGEVTVRPGPAGIADACRPHRRR